MREGTTLKTDSKFSSKHILVALVFAIIGILCIGGGNYLIDNVEPVLSSIGSILSNIGSVLLISGIYTIIDNMILKESLIEMVVQKINLKKDIDETGLIKIGNNLTDVPYSELLGNASANIDIIHNYARTWTTNNLDFIKNSVLNKECKLRVVLLNPDSPFVGALEKHYGYSEGQLLGLIKEAVDTWKGLYQEIEKRREQKKRVGIMELYYFNGQPTDSLYRIDDKVIVVATKNSKTKSTYLPFIIYQKNGENGLYAIYLKEIETIINEATKVEITGGQ